MGRGAGGDDGGEEVADTESPAQLAGGSLQTGDKPQEVVSPPGFLSLGAKRHHQVYRTPGSKAAGGHTGAPVCDVWWYLLRVQPFLIISGFFSVF